MASDDWYFPSPMVGERILLRDVNRIGEITKLDHAKRLATISVDGSIYLAGFERLDEMAFQNPTPEGFGPLFHFLVVHPEQRAS